MSSRLVHRNIVWLARSGLHLTAADIRRQASTHEGPNLSVDTVHVVYEMMVYSDITQTSSLPSSITSEDVADVALGQWKLEPYKYGIGDDVKYTDTKLQDFANIIYYKTTEYGCHYQVCTNNIAMVPVSVLACVFNNAPQMNEPLYMASTTGRVDGCNFDSDCQEYVPFSKCTATASTSNSYRGLCYTTNVTTFITPSFEASSTPVASMSTTVPATAGFLTTAEESVALSSTSFESTEFKPETTEAASTTTQATAMSSSKATEETTATSEAATTTEATTVASTTTTPISATTVPPNPMTEALRLKVIDMHNYRRSRLAQGLVPNAETGKNAPAGSNIYELKYNLDLEKDAQQYANTCPQTPSPVSSRSSQGETLQVLQYDPSKSYYDILVTALQSSWKEIKESGVDEAMMFTEALEYNSWMPPIMFTQSTPILVKGTRTTPEMVWAHAKEATGPPDKTAMDFEAQGKRPQGAPKKRWRDFVKKDSSEVTATAEFALDRTKWRKLTRTVDPATARD
ncbi:SCP-like protein [Teladorsagia circumcincta]|uniref:SCP-like protein n=1 Tax=Teladorsagia circumcincta TaxID=45464 RepID=A0A2G9UZN0_TELCI|nr:SCP-like protein [Teladorsagia circumcincta]